MGFLEEFFGDDERGRAEIDRLFPDSPPPEQLSTKYQQASQARKPTNTFPDPKPITPVVRYIVIYLAGIVTGIIGYLIVGL